MIMMYDEIKLIKILEFFLIEILKVINWNYERF